MCLLIYAHLPFKAIQLLNQSSAPDEIKEAGRKQFWKTSLLSIAILPLDLLSPVVVPFLLLFTKWEDERLGLFNSIWGNDASINGDVRMEGS